jgi:N-acetylglutamate synthase-like GNAT family acetyltransferase
MRLRLASSSDFETLRGCRTRTFSDELGLQQSHYKDVFNDYFSKNIILESDGRLLGAVRLAFSREAQEFFISYLFILPEYRSHSHTGLLLGAIFLLMRANGIEMVRADSADENLAMYTAAGCMVIGPRFKKYGFTCDWIPMMYRLGTNRETEERLIHHAQMQLPLGNNLKWQFVPTLLSCANMHEYQCTVDWLIRSGSAMKMVPHLAPQWRPKAPFLRDPVIACAEDFAKGTGTVDAFVNVNSSLNPLHRIVIGRNSKLRAIGEMYAYLTRKQVVYVDSWSPLAPEAIQGAQSVLFVANPAETNQLISSFASQSPSCLWGVATGAGEEEVSALLLRNYFEFLGPAQHRISVEGFNQLENAFETLAKPTWGSSRDGTAYSRWHSHSVWFIGADPHEARAMLQCLLCTGYTLGEAVRFTNLCFADKLKSPLILVGDPSLRFSAFQPREIECEGGRGKIRLLCSPDNYAMVYHQQTQTDGDVGDFDAYFKQKPYSHTSCHEAGLLHSFIYSPPTPILPD